MAGIFAAIVPARSQPTNQDQSQMSRVQWANACSVAVKFTLLGDVVEDPWRAGGQVSGGPTAALSWQAIFNPAPPAADLKESFELKSGGNCAAVLIGDFKKMDQVTQEKLPAGCTKLEDKSILRAALLRFPISSKTSGDLPVYLVNGDPEATVKVSLEGGASYQVKYGEPVSFKIQAAQFIKIKLEARGLDRELGFSLEDNQAGEIIAFYRSPDQEQTKFVFVNLLPLNL